MADFAVLILLLQELGIALGLGSATFSLLFYVMSVRDADAEGLERYFSTATTVVLLISLGIAGITGGLITGAHYLAGEFEILSAPVFLSSWFLIVVSMVVLILKSFKVVSRFIFVTISGASWYALFIIHALSPELPWIILGGGYALWLAIFVLSFLAFKKRDTSVGVVVVAQPKVNKSVLPVMPMKKPTPAQPHPNGFDLSKELDKASSATSVAQVLTP